MSFCLTPNTAEKLKQAIVSGKIDIDRLSGGTSKERQEFFSSFFGNLDTGKKVNALFESKLLLKNQKLGLVNWAKELTGIKPEVQRDLISRIEKMDKILSPEDRSKFLNDLASKRLGTDITIEEADKIMELSNKITKLKESTDITKSDIPLGRAKLELSDYVNSLNPQKAGIVSNIPNIPRSVMASLDLSAPLNQGWGMLSRKQFYPAFRDMFKYAFSKDKFADLQADIITRPNYKAAKKAGLRLTDLGTNLQKREEQFMTNLLDKVPGIAGSQRAYTGFLNKLRMDVFDDLVKKAGLAGEDINPGSKVFEDLAKVVNNFTGGAQVGKFEQATPALNALFFSPRKITSTLQMLNPVNYVNPNISPTARKSAIRNLLGSLTITASIISLARALGAEEPETDPRSSEFGKIKVGNSRVDMTGGNGTYAVLLARILSQSIKTQAGTIKPLGTKIGETSGFYLVSNAMRYKLSPNASLVADAITGANAIGEKKTIPQSVLDRFKPMFITSFLELADEDPDAMALALPAIFGGGLSTYEPKESKPKSKPIPLKPIK